MKVFGIASLAALNLATVHAKVEDFALGNLHEGRELQPNWAANVDTTKGKWGKGKWGKGKGKGKGKRGKGKGKRGKGKKDRKPFVYDDYIEKVWAKRDKKLDKNSAKCEKKEDYGTKFCDANP